ITVFFGMAMGACQSLREGKAEAVYQLPPSFDKQSVYFAFDSAVIHPNDWPLLKKVAEQLKLEEKAVAILEGHTDSIGSPDYNEILAEKRARAVRVYLRDQGADARRMTILSWGEQKPKIPDNNLEAHQKNRRVEIAITLNGSEKEAL
ncbi:MAG: OmpA family protein, partial [bacterium]|nr:OmpA family protein [bacterium]